MKRALINTFGCVCLFGIGMACALVIKSQFELDWDRALLIQILWVVSMNRWHQAERK